ncbi:MAG: YmdB family metallophosphoesterase [Candidatus Gastranaerophilales bacterium]
MSGSANTIKILFLGDMVGKPGRAVVKEFIEDLKNKNALPDFIIANVENASHGFGLTEKNYNELIEYGINGMTSGNHIWDKREIFNYIDMADKLVRPINYPETAKGVGSRILETSNGIKIGVLTLLGEYLCHQ